MLILRNYLRNLEKNQNNEKEKNEIEKSINKEEEMLEMINRKIEAELPDLQLPKYHIVKLRDGMKEFLAYNYTISEYSWSNDTVESYIIDSSILVSVHSATRLVEVMDEILKKTNFELIATGINKDTMNWEATFYCAFEVNESEI